MKIETLKYTDAKGLKIFAQTMINHKESHIHVVKTIVIAKMIDFYAVINTDTLKITPFDTEDEALDHVLDYYGSIDAQQSKLFNSSLHTVSKCDFSLLTACKICGEEKGLDADFWKKKNAC